MYKLTAPERIYNPAPWKIDFEERKKRLYEAKDLGLYTVAFIYPQFDSSTFRYRAYNICESLDLSFRWRGSYFEMCEAENIKCLLSVIDILVLVRCEWNFSMRDLVESAKQSGINICYDIDDLIYDPKYMELVIETLGIKEGTEWDFWFAYTVKHQKMLDLCDVMLSTNDYLADFLQKDLNKKCYVIPNYLNRIQEDVSREYLIQKRDANMERPFVIGYFSGSPTHKNDLKVALPEILRFLDKTKDTKLQIVGYMDLPEETKSYYSNGRIEHIPFQTFVELQKKIAEVDINIVPLLVNQFTNCKSELKYFEAGIVGTVTCASPSYTYRKSMENLPHGYLCKQGEWFDAFMEIYESGKSIERMQQLSESCLDRYSYIKQVKKIESIFDTINQQDR